MWACVNVYVCLVPATLNRIGMGWPQLAHLHVSQVRADRGIYLLDKVINFPRIFLNSRITA